MRKQIIPQDPAELRGQIDEEIIQVIATASILNLMVDGVAKDNEQVGMALEEIGRRLDKSARTLLESWENLAQYVEDANERWRSAREIAGTAGEDHRLHG